MSQKLIDQMMERLLDSMMVGIETFMHEHSGWFFLASYCLAVIAISVIYQVIEILLRHFTFIFNKLSGKK
jgi:hypothetical protein